MRRRIGASVKNGSLNYMPLTDQGRDSTIRIRSKVGIAMLSRERETC